MELKLNYRNFNKDEEVSWIIIEDKKERTVAEVKGLHYGISNEKAKETAKVFVKAYEMKELLEQITELNKITLTLNPSVSKLYKKAINLLNGI